MGKNIVNQPPKTLVSEFTTLHASLRNYLVGLASCLILTLLAFDAVLGNWFNRRLTIAWIAGLALVQAVIQLTRFLHLGQELKPRYKLIIFSVMLTIILILVVGSLWIMSSLNSRMMLSPAQQNQYMQGQDGL